MTDEPPAKSADSQKKSGDSESDEKPKPAADESGSSPLVVYAAAAVFGFAFLFLELVWYRMLAPVLGGSTFTFGLILGVALAGIGIGGYLYTLRGRDRPATMSLFGGDRGPRGPLRCTPPRGGRRHRADGRSWPFGSGPRLRIARHELDFGSRLSWFCPPRSSPAISFRSCSPSWAAVDGASLDTLEPPMRSTPRAPSSGPLSAGSFSFPRSARWLPGASSSCSWSWFRWARSCWLCDRTGRTHRTLIGFASGSAVIAALLMIAEGPTAIWRHSAVGAGRAQVSGMTHNGLKKWTHESQSVVKWERDGVESGVAFGIGTGASFIVNGKSDGSVFADRATMVMATVLPAILHGSPKRVYVIGLGLGMSAGWVAKVPGVERVDVAELEPAIIDVARDSKAANFDVVNLPNVEIFEGDGREFLLTSRETYDLIMSEPSNPYRAGVASLFTTEFYQASARADGRRRHLRSMDSGLRSRRRHHPHRHEDAPNRVPARRGVDHSAR